MKPAGILTLVLALSGTVLGQAPFRPTQTELVDAYRRANEFQRRAENAVLNATLTHGWIDNGAGLWFRKDGPSGTREFLRVDGRNGKVAPAFDHVKLAQGLTSSLGRTIQSDRLPFDAIAFQADEKLTFRVSSDAFTFDLKTGAVTKGGAWDSVNVQQTEIESEPNPEYPAPYLGTFQRGQGAQDSRVRVREGQVELRTGDAWTVVSKQGSYARAISVPNSDKVLAFRLLPGSRQLVYLLKAAVSGSTRAALEQRLYDQPGDKLDEYEIWIIDGLQKSEAKVEIPPIMGGGQPWGGPPGVQWRQSTAFIEFPIRGYREHKIIALDPATGNVRTVVHETSPTFIDQSKTNARLLADGKELIWQSERDGWSHLYLISTETGSAKPITKGKFVVRGINHIDESSRQIWFTASGLGDAKNNPYHLHLCTVNFDGTGFKQLTQGDGTHFFQFSPERKLFIDSFSRVDMAPVHELRRTDSGELVAALVKADASLLAKNGIRAPEVFSAKGRDGKTDIWGIVVKPSNFDAKKKYPVIENIYAGPHDSHVPHGFRPFFNMHRLAELGFIVVQIDGMGTNNRGKAFHDVCWKNVADAGFPDRILWMKALAKKMPQADIDRVGIYGTSAGGQSSTGGMLFHPEFYKVAVSACGCHDNRIDKQWWNEQWMGYPVASHYDEQSNITNASKLKGRLMLIVGEQDRNVPPESTFRLADALIKARKDFEIVVIPGADHTDGGPYGERKRRDFFVRWLHGVEPPSVND